MKYDWFRSYHGAPTDPKWLVIANKAKVPVHLVVSIVWGLLDYASQHHDRGSVEDFDSETLATFYGCCNEDATSVVAALRDKKIIGENNRFAKWEERQGDETNAPLSSTERSRKYRAKQKELEEQNKKTINNYENTKDYINVTQCNDATKRNEIRNDATDATPIEIEKENKKDKKELPSGSSKKATRFNFSELPPDWLAFCREKRPDLNPQAVFEKFSDYWKAKAGKDAVKLDWLATWRNWLRNEQIPKPQNQPKPPKTPHPNRIIL